MPAEPMLCGRPVATDRALVMAIVNRTPDSFHDRGAHYAEAAALARVEAVVAQGADVIDVGGVKAGPGPEVTVAEEIGRVVDFIATVRTRWPQLLISVDTWRHEVAERALAAGADLVNDTWAGADPELVEVAAAHGAGIVCSHTGGAPPRTRPHRVRYDDVVAAVLADVTTRARQAEELGIAPGNILLDPTHDFGKNTYHSLELLRRADELVAAGWPVLMALSNKDFVGETLGVEPDDRLTGTLAATAVAAAAGVRMFRAHEVAATRSTVEMVASVRGTRRPSYAVRGLA